MFCCNISDQNKTFWLSWIKMFPVRLLKQVKPHFILTCSTFICVLWAATMPHGNCSLGASCPLFLHCGLLSLTGLHLPWCSLNEIFWFSSTNQNILIRVKPTWNKIFCLDFPSGKLKKKIGKTETLDFEETASSVKKYLNRNFLTLSHVYLRGSHQSS